MASQRVMLFTIAGPFAQEIWSNIQQWSNALRNDDQLEWSSDDWPAETHEEVDRFVARLIEHGFTPPVLYRSEHVDLWSMGDIFTGALGKSDADWSRRLLTHSFGVIATRVSCREKVYPPRGAAPEYRWLYARINEAITAWGPFAEERLVLLVRNVIGGLWMDDEVEKGLREIPDWWSADNRR